MSTIWFNIGLHQIEACAISGFRGAVHRLTKAE